MTVTPVANWPSAWRKSVAVRGVAIMFEVFEDTILRAIWRKAALPRKCGGFGPSNFPRVGPPLPSMIGGRAICQKKSQDPNTVDPGTRFLGGLRLLCSGRSSANPHHGRGTNLYLLPAHRTCRVSRA